MSPQAVRRSLLEQPELPKEVRLNDGSRVIVRQREQWLAAGDYLIVLLGRFDTRIAYHNIAAIRVLPAARRKKVSS
ncbi:MAG: hypothetical protein HYY17_13315 [Planctomycetes bacterium]|nr:hypothetical protein [Planctomycetota bacterium]